MSLRRVFFGVVIDRLCDDLATGIFAACATHMVRTLQLAAATAFNIARSAKRIVRAPLVTLGARNFLSWNRHGAPRLYIHLNRQIYAQVTP